jgi:hypothetical protein
MLHKGWGVCLIQVNDGIIDVCHGGHKGLIWPLPLARWANTWQRQGVESLDGIMRYLKLQLGEGQHMKLKEAL